MMGWEEFQNFSSAVENCGEAVSTFWWLQLDAVFENSEEFVALSKMPFFWIHSRVTRRDRTPNDEVPAVDVNRTTFEVAKVEDPKLYKHLAPSGILGQDSADDALLGTGTYYASSNQFCKSTLMHQEFAQLPKIRTKSTANANLARMPFAYPKPDDVEVVYVEMIK